MDKVQQTKNPQKISPQKHITDQWKSTFIPENEQDNSISLMHL